MGNGDTARPGVRRRRRIAVVLGVAALAALLVSLFLVEPETCRRAVRTNAGGVSYGGERSCANTPWPSVLAILGVLAGLTSLVVWAAGRRSRGEEASDEAPMFPQAPW